MKRSYIGRLIAIVLLAAGAVWTVLPNNPGIHIGSYDRDVRVVRGLDLQGGLRVLLEVDLPQEVTVEADQMETVKGIIEKRVNALGVTEPIVQVAGSRRVLVELPGIGDPSQAVEAIQETGLLEFVELTRADLAALGTDGLLQTDFGQELTAPSSQASATPTAIEGTQTVSPASSAPPSATTVPADNTDSAPTQQATAGNAATGMPAATAAEAGVTTAVAPSATAEPLPTPTPKVLHTVMTGAEIESVVAARDQAGVAYEVAFTLKPNGAQVFGDYTSTHVGEILGIVLDKRLISAPVINDAITEGQGRITGRFTYEEANTLAVQLRYGSLPLPLKVVESKTVGPTLGQDSLRKSTIAGVIGLAVIALFMALYYRLPGILADLALLLYATLTFALFKLLPVTLTLPGIAGFVLSIGVAVDANVLIFERMKEELRAGKNLRVAIDLGFSRAWPSIRDSNLSTLITCAILFWFGNTFGASIVKGFSLTLALGVLVSLFTAITVTRTFLHLVLDSIRLDEHPRLFGV